MTLGDSDEAKRAADLNAGSSDPSDGREKFQWKTHYPRAAWTQITIESIYLLLLLSIGFTSIFEAWTGGAALRLGIGTLGALTLKRYLYFSAAGLIGGVAFGTKFLYRAVARGYWHQDRLLWRVKSPLLAMTLAFIVGAVSDTSLIPTRTPGSGASCISMGFLVGYFADQAIAKMYEIARVLFGTSAGSKAFDAK